LEVLEQRLAGRASESPEERELRLANARAEMKARDMNKTPTHEITGAVIESGAFTPMRENAIEKVVKGITTFEEAASAVEF
jgi:type II secretory ATPase GspE/PulE/Tfp pilus assembly ATPase PilB-like protein